MDRTSGHLIGLPNLNFIEIGSFEGFSVCRLLENILTDPSSRLVCIDTFDYSSQEGWYALVEFCSMTVGDRFNYNIEQTGCAYKVKKCVGKSQSLPCMSADFIYVDGSHEAKDVIQDAVLGWGLLKVGGIMTFDDYKLQRPGSTTPKAAVDAFLSCFEGDYRLLEKEDQVTIERLR